MRFLDRMKARWGVGLWGVLAILITFSLAGMTVVRLRRPIMAFLLPDHHAAWMTWAVYALVMVPIYQVVLLAYGSLLGQFRFFWEKEKRMGQFLLRLVGIRFQ